MQCNVNSPWHVKRRRCKHASLPLRLRTGHRMQSSCVIHVAPGRLGCAGAAPAPRAPRHKQCTAACRVTCLHAAMKASGMERALRRPLAANHVHALCRRACGRHVPASSHVCSTRWLCTRSANGTPYVCLHASVDLSTQPASRRREHGAHRDACEGPGRRQGVRNLGTPACALRHAACAVCMRRPQ